MSIKRGMDKEDVVRIYNGIFSSVQSLSRIQLFVTHGLQHTRPPCPSPTPGACSNSCLLSQWCHPTILSSVGPFSSCRPSFPASGSFPMSQFFTLGGQSIVASAPASVLPMNIQDWFPLGWTDWISLQSKGLSRVFSNTIFFCQCLNSNPHSTLFFICDSTIFWSSCLSWFM